MSNFAQKALFRSAGWPDGSAKNRTIYCPFGTWSKLSNKRFYKFPFVPLQNVTFIRNIISSHLIFRGNGNIIIII